jgi:hypothetical protein
MALPTEITCGQNATEHKELALGTILILREHLLKSHLKLTASAVTRHDIKPFICRWSNSMLEDRYIKTLLAS